MITNTSISLKNKQAEKLYNHITTRPGNVSANIPAFSCARLLAIRHGSFTVNLACQDSITLSK